ncbi:MAG: hypothetical protein JWN34_631, partial [Bryobacterales bacterium]|nr:hypothetical protein [Bryobacterales bacterium]
RISLRGEVPKHCGEEHYEDAADADAGEQTGSFCISLPCRDDGQSEDVKGEENLDAEDRVPGGRKAGLVQKVVDSRDEQQDDGSQDHGAPGCGCGVFGFDADVRREGGEAGHKSIEPAEGTSDEGHSGDDVEEAEEYR